MPGHDSVQVSTLENDTAVVRHEKVFGGSTPGAWIVDPNPYYGRVLYTPGLVIDQPLGVTRWELQDSVQASAQFERYANPFTMVPHWNLRGMADMGTFADGGIGSRPFRKSSTRTQWMPSTSAGLRWAIGWRRPTIGTARRSRTARARASVIGGGGGAGASGASRIARRRGGQTFG